MPLSFLFKASGFGRRKMIFDKIPFKLNTFSIFLGKKVFLVLPAIPS